jgi:hypothetical protein
LRPFAAVRLASFAHGIFISAGIPPVPGDFRGHFPGDTLKSLRPRAFPNSAGFLPVSAGFRLPLPTALMLVSAQRKSKRFARNEQWTSQAINRIRPALLRCLTAG